MDLFNGFYNLKITCQSHKVQFALKLQELLYFDDGDISSISAFFFVIELQINFFTRIELGLF